MWASRNVLSGFCCDVCTCWDQILLLRLFSLVCRGTSIICRCSVHPVSSLFLYLYVTEQKSIRCFVDHIKICITCCRCAYIRIAHLVSRAIETSWHTQYARNIVYWCWIERKLRCPWKLQHDVNILLVSASVDMGILSVLQGPVSPAHRQTLMMRENCVNRPPTGTSRRYSDSVTCSATDPV